MREWSETVSVIEVWPNLKDKYICSDFEYLKFYTCSLSATRLPTMTGDVGLSESLYQMSHCWLTWFLTRQDTLIIQRSISNTYCCLFGLLGKRYTKQEGGLVDIMMLIAVISQHVIHILRTKVGEYLSMPMPPGSSTADREKSFV